VSARRTSAHPAVAARRRKVERSQERRRRSWLLGAMVVAIALLGAWFLVTGPLLAVDSVAVSGYDRPDRAELEAALAVAAASGTAIRPPAAEIREAAEAFPWVESVRVSRDLPRGVSVRITAAEPVAIVRSPDRPPLLVDDRGRVLERAASASGLPSIRLVKPAPEPGGQLTRGATAAIGFLSATRPELAARVRGLGVRGGQLQGTLADGPKLRLGAPDRLVAKGAAFAALLDHLSADEEAQATYIDLSVPERPAVGGIPLAPPADDDGLE